MARQQLAGMAARLRGLCLVFAASSALKLPALRAKRPAHAPAPAIFTADDARPIVLFDGECNLCNAGVNILLDYDACSRDGRGNLRVAALQSTVGRLLLSRLSADQRARAVDAASGEYSSIVVAGRDRAWVGSGAVLKIGRQLKAPLKWLAVLGWCVPWFARDFVYGQISRRRKRWFGEADQCRLWDDNYDMRFVSDAVVGCDDRVPVAGGVTKAAAAADAAAFAHGDAVVVAAEQPVVMASSASEDVLGNGMRGVVEAPGDADGRVVVRFDEPATFAATLDERILRKVA